MRISKIQESIIHLNQHLDAVERELPKYKDAAYNFLEAESVGKMARYGKEYYRENYLKSPFKNCSDFMKSFLYCFLPVFQCIQ